MTAPKVQHTDRDPVVAALEVVKKHQRTLFAVAAIMVLAVAAVLYMRMAREREESYASSLLTDARVVASSGNLALAMTDLSDLAANHRGTIAAEEAEILLGQLRLSEGQADAAVQSLQEYVGRGPSGQFRAPAYGLLAVALEQVNSLTDAASAYENAAAAAWYDFLKAQYLLDAARVRAELGDTTQAAVIYRRILDAFSETDMVMEARLRLAELERSNSDNR